jgi:hypothetical protein
MSRWHFASDVHAITLTDAHQYSMSKPSSRIKAPGYGSSTRSVPYVDITCQQCERDLQNPLNGALSRVEDVSLTLSEMEWQWGKAQKAKTTIEALRAQLDELELGE